MVKVKVLIRNDQVDVKIPSGIRLLLRRCVHAVLDMEKFEGPAEVVITFVDNAQIRELNKKHRNIDKETDVLSFPMGENGKYDINPETGNKILGDVVVSVEKAIEHANEYGFTLQRELGFLVVHSMLHLLGYDHQTNMDKLRMREREEDILRQVGLPSTESYGVSK